MLRATWFGIVVAMAPMAACSKDSETPAVAAHAAVGKVVAISGKVSAIRGGQTRVLAMGGEIFGDDEVVVGADGSIGIDLAHNNARWSLEAGRRGKVRDSLAWTMAKVDTPAKPVEHATSAAGREGERSAATSATTESDRVRGEEPVGGAPGGTPEPVAQPEPPKTTTTPPKPSLPKPPKKGAGGGGGKLQTADSFGAGPGRLGSDHKTRATNPPPPPPPPPDRKPDMDNDDVVAPIDSEDAKRQDAIRKVIDAQKPTLRQCPGAAGLKVNITVARSVAKVAIVGGKTADPAATQKCMETKLQQLKLARAEPFSVILDL